MAKQVVGVKLPCPLCSEREAQISMYLDDCTFLCNSCDNNFDRECIEDIIRMWPKILAWVDTMPTNME